MDVRDTSVSDAKSARAFVRAWRDHQGAAWYIREAAEVQRRCERLAWPDEREMERYRAAARVLERAAAKLGRV